MASHPIRRPDAGALADGYRRCARITRENGTTYYWGARMLPKAPRHHVYAVYALARLADICGVEMIVVGSRRRGVRSGLKEFFAGSVAAQLAHRQHRPVVVVPVHPVAAGTPLPWEDPPLG